MPSSPTAVLRTRTTSNSVERARSESGNDPVIAAIMGQSHSYTDLSDLSVGGDSAVLQPPAAAAARPRTLSRAGSREGPYLKGRSLSLPLEVDALNRELQLASLEGDGESDEEPTMREDPVEEAGRLFGACSAPPSRRSKSMAKELADVVRQEGYLEKRGQWNTSFQIRWFQLRAGHLYYFKSTGLAPDHPQGSVYLGGATFKEDPAPFTEDYVSWTFTVRDASGRNLVLKATRKEDYFSWKDAIQKCSQEFPAEEAAGHERRSSGSGSGEAFLSYLGGATADKLASFSDKKDRRKSMPSNRHVFFAEEDEAVFVDEGDDGDGDVATATAPEPGVLRERTSTDKVEDIGKNLLHTASISLHNVAAKLFHQDAHGNPLSPLLKPRSGSGSDEPPGLHLSSATPSSAKIRGADSAAGRARSGTSPMLGAVGGRPGARSADLSKLVGGSERSVGSCGTADESEWLDVGDADEVVSELRKTRSNVVQFQGPLKVHGSYFGIGFIEKWFERYATVTARGFLNVYKTEEDCCKQKLLSSLYLADYYVELPATARVPGATPTKESSAAYGINVVPTTDEGRERRSSLLNKDEGVWFLQVGCKGEQEEWAENINVVIPQQVEEDTYENQRYNGKSKSWAAEHLFQSDSPAWSDHTGSIAKPKETIDVNALPNESWEWADSWELDCAAVDDKEQGWEYTLMDSKSMNLVLLDSSKDMWGPSEQGKLLRRRKWVRNRRRNVAQAVEVQGYLATTEPARLRQATQGLVAGQAKLVELGEKGTLTGDSSPKKSTNFKSDTKEVDFTELEVLEQLGGGVSGSVYASIWRETRVAVKRFYVDLDEDESEMEVLGTFQMEVDILTNITHPNVVPFIGACSTLPNLCILTELMPNVLSTVLWSMKKPLKCETFFKLLRGIATGMHFLHSFDVVHADLKSPNVLVDDGRNARLCDFGFTQVKRQSKKLSWDGVGTPGWAAPELLRNEPFDSKADVFSFGVVLWELENCAEPYKGQNAFRIMHSVGREHQRLEPYDAGRWGANTGAKPRMNDSDQLMRDCWAEDPEDRPDFKQILERIGKVPAKGDSEENQTTPTPRPRKKAISSGAGEQQRAASDPIVVARAAELEPTPASESVPASGSKADYSSELRRPGGPPATTAAELRKITFSQQKLLAAAAAPAAAAAAGSADPDPLRAAMQAGDKEAVARIMAELKAAEAQADGPAAAAAAPEPPANAAAAAGEDSMELPQVEVRAVLRSGASQRTLAAALEKAGGDSLGTANGD